MKKYCVIDINTLTDPTIKFTSKRATHPLCVTIRQPTHDDDDNSMWRLTAGYVLLTRLPDLWAVYASDLADESVTAGQWMTMMVNAVNRAFDQYQALESDTQ